MSAPPPRPPTTAPRLEVAAADPKGTLIKKTNTTSWVHKHFHVYSINKKIAHCDLCVPGKDLSWAGSTSTLTDHVRSQHRTIYDDEMRAAAAALVNQQQAGMSQFVNRGCSRNEKQNSTLKFIIDAGLSKGKAPVLLLLFILIPTMHPPLNSLLPSQFSHTTILLHTCYFSAS